MAQDIRQLFKEEQEQDNNSTLSQGHEARFLEKLNKELPKKAVKPKSNWLSIAASVALFIALGFSGYNYFKQDATPVKNINPVVVDAKTESEVKTTTLGDLSPDLKKVEDYYLASIHNELSKVELTPENKELIDGYIDRLEVLSKEYKRLSKELTESGPSELTVNALIDNLKLRLNLLYRLRDQLNDLSSEIDEAQQSI